MIRYLTALAARLHRTRCPECWEPHHDVAAHVRDDHPDLWSDLMSKHGMSAEIVWRNEDNSLRTWRIQCSCRKAEWTGPTYEHVEDEWRKHVHALTGKAPTPAGKTEGRWTS